MGKKKEKRKPSGCQSSLKRTSQGKKKKRSSIISFRKKREKKRIRAGPHFETTRGSEKGKKGLHPSPLAEKTIATSRSPSRGKRKRKKGIRCARAISHQKRDF